MNSHRCQRDRTNYFVPRLEGLEDRCCPAAIQVFGGTMLITGDGMDNTVMITDQGNGTVNASITGVGGPIMQMGTNIRNILVNTQDGADVVTYNLSAAQNVGKILTVNLGRGADQATVNASAGIGRAALVATVLGGDDVDRIQGTLGALAQGGLGYLIFDGGRGNDNVSAMSTGLLNGALIAALSGGQGIDMVTGNLNVAAGSTGYLAATVLGGSENDNLTLNVNDSSGGTGASTLQLALALIDGGDGTDTCVKTANVRAIRCEA